MICVKANLKANVWFTLGIYLKSCEIKGGGHEMAVMILIIINFINAESHYYHPHQCSHFMAATFDFTIFHQAL